MRYDRHDDPATGEYMVPARRGTVVRDFIVFQMKLALDGIKDLLAIKLSIAAIVIDVLMGRGRRPRLFYGVVRASQRFDGWLDLHRMKGRPRLRDPDR